MVQSVIPVPAKDQVGIELISEARKAIAAFREGAESNYAIIRLVYFHPVDREPLPDWDKRLQWVVTDIDQFYHNGFKRFSLDEHLPLAAPSRFLCRNYVYSESPGVFPSLHEK